MDRQKEVEDREETHGEGLRQWQREERQRQTEMGEMPEVALT